MSHDFRFPFFPILIALPHLLGSSRSGCLLAYLVRGVDGLRGLCVALCSRLIASGSSGILFLVPCDGFLSAFLFLARCYCMSGFIFVALSLSPRPVFLSSGVSGTRAIFFIDLPACLPYHLSRSSRALPLLRIASCSTAILLRLSNIVPSIAPPARHVERGDYGMRCLLAGGTTNCVIRAVAMGN